MAEQWQRKENESDRAFMAFRAYRDQGIGNRSIKKACEEYHVKDWTQSKHRQWESWSSHHSWVHRVRAWDAELDKEQLEAEKEAIKKMRDRHVLEAGLLQAVASKALVKLQEKVLSGKELAPTVILQLMTGGANMERLARGEPTEIAKRLAETQTVEVTYGDRAVPIEPDPINSDASDAPGSDPDQGSSG